MTQRPVPTIFSQKRREARLVRARSRQRRAVDPARFVLDDMGEDLLERLAFVRHDAQSPCYAGLVPQSVHDHFAARGRAAAMLDSADIERPFADRRFDLVAVFGEFDAVNDLPGALIHIRNALAPEGLAIVSFVGGSSLPKLRAAMMAADGDKPAARIHPMVDPRAAPGLLQRAGWSDPVVDTHRLTVRYGSLDTLVGDLRDQGLNCALADHARSLGKAALERARAAFRDQADTDGKTAETFDIITLTGRRSPARG
ncbi:methyltransferase [Qipengyuania nanhaisediminis]|uniref:methyltransferase n=1 Tax=Qipengyuania nanhaisediminis TaxID=604088 RepID=UPI0038B2D2E4